MEINHMSIERKEIRHNPNGGFEKEIYVNFKKPRRPRKWKKRFLRLNGYPWTKDMVTGWMWLDDVEYFPVSGTKYVAGIDAYK